MRAQAQNMQDCPQQILGNALRGVPVLLLQTFQSEAPSGATFEDNVAVGDVLTVPATCAALPNPLPREYTTGDHFLPYDSGDQDRILIIATDERLTLLENNAHWFIDGTFDAVP